MLHEEMKIIREDETPPPPVTSMLNGIANVELWRKLVSSVAKPSPAAELEPGSEVGWVKRALTFLPLYYLPSTIHGPAGEAGPGERRRRCSRSPAAAAAGPRLEAGSCHLLGSASHSVTTPPRHARRTLG